tara:strand:+ start:10886 stop:11182 length:297 start_codon:yes stop_codon:yes gene_type:complete
MHSNYKNISRGLAESAASVLKGETLTELTDAQKKLPAGLQKAIAKKDGDKKDEELSDAQKKMDKNDNGKIDGEDLAKLRAKKEQLEEVIRELESKLVE